MPLRIACIHQGYELYGSDRSFAESVVALRHAYPDADIEVVLPRTGPIVALLEGTASRITFEPIWVLRKRSLPRLIATGIGTLPGAVVRAARRFSRNDLVYINTSVVTDYALAARLFRGRGLLHVHEIPEGAARHLLRGFVAFSACELIFNSRATQAAFALRPTDRHHVVYNGLAVPQEAPPIDFDGTRPLRVLMLGRINGMKGQEILLEAIAALPAEVRARIDVRMVGSAFESEAKERDLHALVGTLGVSDRVSLEPFLDDPASLYEWADVVSVPSRRPEPLGRVAIEAMAYGRPPIASAIGGLVEIVVDGVTGWLVPPGDVAALATALTRIVEDPGMLREPARAGRERYETVFSEEAASTAITAITNGMLARRTGRAASRGTAR